MKKILFSILLIASIGAKAQSWTPKATGFTTPNRLLNSISIANKSDIWATAIDYTDALNPGYTVHEFTLSTDGGNTWTPGTINLGQNTADLGVSSITAISSTTAWISVYPDVVPTTQLGGIWQTTNGGSIWTKQESALFNASDSYPNFVYFWDANNGIAQGDPEAEEFEIYTTTDGGTNWNRVPADNVPNPSPIGEEYGYFNRYCVSGSTIWFGTNKGRIFKSTNKGLNWTVSQSPSTDFTLDRFTFSDPNKGLLMKYDLYNAATLYSTSDGGENWALVAKTGMLYKTNIVYIPGTSKVISSSSANPLGSSYSIDDGKTWTIIDHDFRGELAFLDDGFGFSAGLNTSSTVEGISRFSLTPTVTVRVGTYTYNGSDQGPTLATNTGTGTSYTFSYVGTGGTTYAASPTRPTNAGWYTVTATVVANGNYGSASSSATLFSIGVAKPTVSVTVGTYTYSGSDQGPTVATNTGTGSSYTFSYFGTNETTYATSSTRPTNAGTYTATATVAANGNYSSASSTDTAFTIDKKGLTITGLTGIDKVYDGNTFASATGTPALNELVLSETVILDGAPTYTFASADVGSAISIFTTGYTISGAAAVNYTLTQPTLSANITIAPLKAPSFDIKKQISVYPNPTKGELLQIDSENTLIKYVSVLDLLGRRVISSEFSSLKKVSLDLKSLKSGTFVLKVTSDSGKTETMKIIKN